MNKLSNYDQWKTQAPEEEKEPIMTKEEFEEENKKQLNKMLKVELIEYLKQNKDNLKNKDLLSEVNDAINKKHNKPHILKIAQFVKKEV